MHNGCVQPSDAVVVSATVTLLLADLCLAKRGHDVITDSLRRHKIVFFVGAGVLALHVLDVLGPADPFKAAAKLVMRDGK